MRRWRFTILIAIFTALITLPYLLARFSGGGEYVFGGFLLNPIDGNSYLAKMQEGWSGSWAFTLPYTAEQGQGAYLFLFYLFLGHLSRWLNLPLLVTFHLARVLSAVWMLFALRALFRRMFPWSSEIAWNALVLAVFGSGFGWLMAFAGRMAPDLWVAEAYPFLSAYANPHFPLGLALMAGIFLLTWEAVSVSSFLKLVLYGALLAIVMPFGIVVTAVVLAAKAIWDWLADQQLRIAPLIGSLLAGGPLLLYQFIAIQKDPLLSGWNAQNLTPAPAVWDLLIALFPAVLLAIFALWRDRKQAIAADKRLLVVWFVLGMTLIYMPFNLQRRFMFGLYIPTAALAVAGLSELSWLRGRLHGARLWPFVLGASVLTNAIILLAVLGGVMAHSPDLYLTQSEASALSWIGQNTPPKAVILCSPEFGKYIPAQTGRRVVYGHPFETVAASEKRDNVLAFYHGGWDAATAKSFLDENHVDYVLVGPRERPLIEVYLLFLEDYRLVYQKDTTMIYAVGGMTR